MKEHKLTVFDMDGTLLDSMPYWESVGRNYLLGKGIAVADDFEQKIEAMTLSQSAAYIKETYGVAGSIEEIIKETLQRISLSYQFEIPAKAGMKQRVKEQKDMGTTVVVLTSSERSCVYAALKRTGLLTFFDEIYLTDEIGMSKTSPDIFWYVCEKHDVLPEETHVFEDAFFAVKAAKQAGCYVTAVYDESMSEHWDEILSYSDDQIKE